MDRRKISVGVIIAAGGRGTRMGVSTPKQFFLLKGKSIIQRSVEVFEHHSLVHEIVIVAPMKYMDRVRRIVRRNGLHKVSRIVSGGKERQDSVWKGLNSFRERPTIVLVHDAVRPLVIKAVVSEVIRLSALHKAAVAGVRVKDTIKVEQTRGYCSKTLDRAKLWAVQTPQGFHFDLLLRAHQSARKVGIRGTDDASLVERINIPVRIVDGGYRNIKITTQEDLAAAKSWLK
ncbi:MAG: 2-C-methyl-D-erythritol 4-phosphate cytidylyltransferase [Ignavibacteria bacterium]|nr:2-C-methyl-D-erythritol 4-phosphate cytidylyltransferase [Ignavibacteria bacterium]